MESSSLGCDRLGEGSLGLTCGTGLVLGVLYLGITRGGCAVECIVGTLEGGIGLSSGFGGRPGLSFTMSTFASGASENVLSLPGAMCGIVLFLVAGGGTLLLGNTLLNGTCFILLLFAEVGGKGGALLQVALLGLDTSISLGLMGGMVNGMVAGTVPNHCSWVTVTV